MEFCRRAVAVAGSPLLRREQIVDGHWSGALARAVQGQHRRPSNRMVNFFVERPTFASAIAVLVLLAGCMCAVRDRVRRKRRCRRSIRRSRS